ncbi:MAG: hypothetical protein ACC742_06920, partial [Thermoanaerobaculales bacterium]
MEVEHAVDTVAGVRTGCAVAASFLPEGAAGEMLVLLVELRQQTTASQHREIADGIAREVRAATGLDPDHVELLAVPAFRRRLRPARVGWSWGWRNHPRLVMAVAAALVTAAVLAIPSVRVESDPVEFLPDDHPTTRAYRSLDGRL